MRLMFPCPAAPDHHGPLLDVPAGSSGRLRCIHQEHDGRPASHPLGAAPATRSAFTLDEIESARGSGLMTPHYADDHLTVWLGDCREVMAAMEPESVHCVVTSPPYWGLRDYGIAPTIWDGDWRCSGSGRNIRKPHHEWGTDGRCSNQGCESWRGVLGAEPTPGLFVEHIVDVFRAVRRVLRKDGTVWLNLGDTYASGTGHAPQPAETLAGGKGGVGDALSHRGRAMAEGSRLDARDFGMKPKDRVMIPARVALALQADGWWLRDEIVWSKPNPMPSSVADRTTPAHEMVYLLTKSARYSYDAAAIRERAESGPSDLRKMAEGRERIGGLVLASDDPMLAASGLTNVGRKRSVGGAPLGKQAAAAAAAGSSATRTYAGFNDRWDAAEAERRNPTWAERKAAGAHAGGHGGGDIEGSGTQRGVHGEGLSHTLGQTPGRNKRSVWTVATQPYPEAHFATFPEKLIEPMILAGCPEGGAVLDCFGGSGTVAVVAQRLGRRAVLVDLSPEYVGQMIARVAKARGAGEGPAGDMPVPFAADGLWVSGRA